MSNELNVEKKIITYEKLLSINSAFDEEQFFRSNEFLGELDIDIIDKYKKSIANIFLKNIGKINQDSNVVDESYIQSIMDAFINIANMESDDDSESCIKVIKFLNFLYRNKEDGIISSKNFNEINLEEEFKLLLSELEKIRCIFSIKVQQKSQFPISRILLNIINSRSFSITTKEFRTLILALQIFNYNNECCDEEIKKIIDKYKLKSLEYIFFDDALKIGDENEWIDNLEKNGVLVLYNENKKKVLIRSVDEEYFNTCSVNYNYKYIQYVEKNEKKDKIAFIYEYDMPEGYNLVSLKEIINKKKYRNLKQILEYIFDKKCYNVFLNKFFLYNGSEIRLINPFVSNDRCICNSGETLASTLTSVIKFLNKKSLEILRGSKLDCATIGLVTLLISINQVSIDKILDRIDSILKNFQNTIIENWLNECDNKVENLSKLLEVFNKEFKYTTSIDEFRIKKITNNPLYPIKINYNILELVDKKYIFTDSEFKEIIVSKNYSGEIDYRFKDGSGEKIENVRYCSTDDKENIKYKDNIVVLFSKQRKEIIIGDEIEKIYKIKNKIEKINASLINYKDLSIIKQAHIDKIESFMKMHIESLTESMEELTGEDISFNSLVKYKLINNLLCYRVIPNKVKDYFELIQMHEVIKYDIVKSDSVIKNLNDSTLLVPKDSLESDATLEYIFSKYIKKSTRRCRINLYDPKLYIRTDGKYALKNKKSSPISKVIILLDNIESGQSTKGVLKGYLGIDKDFRKNIRQTYKCDNKVIQVYDIIEKNNPDIEVYSFYATDNGIKVIIDFLGENYKNKVKVYKNKGFNQEVTEDIKTKIINIFGKFENCVDIGNYIIIREFNQPKKNAFPREMLDTENIIGLFNFRDEIV